MQIKCHAARLMSTAKQAFTYRNLQKCNAVGMKMGKSETKYLPDYHIDILGRYFYYAQVDISARIIEFWAKEAY